MRTLAVMHIPTAAGPPQHIRPWLERLAELGQLAVVAPAPGTALDLYREIGATEALGYRALTFRANPAALVADTARLRAAMRRFDPDVVVVATTVVPTAVAAARLLRKPCVVYVAELLDAGHARTTGRARGAAALLRFTERAATALVCCSHAVAGQFRRGRVEVIYPGVPLAPEAARGNGAPLLVTVGAITHGRGQDVAIRALADVRRALPDARLAIVGVPYERAADERYARELRRLVAELGLDGAVDFRGHVDEIGDVYAAADVVVNPVRLTESLGRVAIEALAAGTPVVSTRVGAVPEVLTDERDALLVPPDDVGALAAAIARLARDDALRRTLVANGRETVRTRFDERAGADAFARLVMGLVRERIAG